MRPQAEYTTKDFLNDLLTDLTEVTINSPQGSNIDIVTFANSILFNDSTTKLWPTQEAILKAIYNEPLEQKHIDILDRWREQGKTNWIKGRKYTNLILEMGRGGSKSSMSAIICLYEFYKLISLPDPGLHFGLMSMTPIALFAIAQTEAQVLETSFKVIKSFLEQSNFFKSLIKKKKIIILSDEIKCPEKYISLYAKHTNSKALVGYNLKLLFIDEMARFETTGDGINTGLNIYENIGRGLNRFKGQGKKIVISSAWSFTDPMLTLRHQAAGDPYSLILELTCFDVNPTISRSSPDILSDYASNPKKARLEYENIRSSNENSFLDANLLDSLCCIQSAIDVIEENVDIEERYYKSLRIFRISSINTACFVHIDTGLKKDSAAMSITTINNKGQIEVIGIGCWTPGIDAHGRFREVSYINIEEVLIYISQYMNIMGVTFDGFNCREENSLVLTPQGYKKAGQLTLKDKVISKEGHINNIKALQLKKEVDSIKIITDNGIELISTYNHPYYIEGKGFIEAQNIKLGDRLEHNSHNTFGSYNNPERALIYGYLVSEGDWQSKSKNSIRMSNMEIEVHKDYETALSIAYPKIKYTTNKFGTIFSNKEFIKELNEEIGCSGAFNKRIPNFIWNSDMETIGCFVSSLFEGDGTVIIDKPRKNGIKVKVEYSTVSKVLSKELQILLSQLGIKSYRKYYTNHFFKGKSHPFYRVTISGRQIRRFAEVVGFRSQRKSLKLIEAISKLRDTRKPRFIKSAKVVSIEHTKANIIHMEVSGDHTYIADNVINHNSASLNQNLYSRGLNTKIVSFSREKQLSYYNLLRQLIQRGDVLFPIDSPWTALIKTDLPSLVIKDNGQIVHPYGTKDLPDALAVSVFEAYTYGSNCNLINKIELKAPKLLNINTPRKITVGSSINRLQHHKQMNNYRGF